MAILDRVRQPHANVTDQTLVQALRACGQTYTAQQDAAEVAKEARSAHSNELKRWKGLGVPLEPLKRAIKDRFLDPAEVLAETHMYVRLRALQNMPTIQQDLAALWTEVDLDEQTRGEVERQRWRDDGAFCAREGHARDSNPHAPGSEAHQQWDQGWLNNQERIARSMGAAAGSSKPEDPDEVKVNTSRTRPSRKRAANKAAAPPPAAAPRKRRRAAEAMH